MKKIVILLFALLAFWVISGCSNDGGEREPEFKLVFNATGGEVTPDTLHGNHGESIRLPLPERDGFRFDGWFSAVSGGTSFGRAGDSHTFDASRVMFAQWAQMHRITFNSHGGTNFSPVTAAHDNTITLPYPIREGRSFVGWFSAAIDGNRLGGGGDRHTVTETATMHARWSSINFVIDFNSAGGENIASITAEEGSPITLPTPIRSGYVFVGWFSDAVGGTEFGDSTRQHTVTASVRMHARWEVVLYAVIFNSRGGSNTPEINMAADSIIVLPTPTRENHRFVGWFSAGDGGVRYGVGGANFAVTANITMYAQWVRIFTVTFNSGGGTVFTAITSEENTRIALPAPTRDTDTFEGWFSASASGVKIGGGGDSILVTANLNLFAQWTVRPRVITFNSHGGTSFEPIAAYQNDTITLPSPTRNGYVFVGWFGEAEHGTGLGRGGARYIVTASTTLHARWVGINTVVIFDSRGGSQVDFIVIRENPTITLPTPTRRGYAFNGWFSAAEDGAPFGVGGGSFTVTGSVTMFAQWTINRYTVTFNTQVGIGTFEPIEAPFDSTIILPTPTRRGHTLMGWFSATDGGERIGAGGATYRVQEDITLYAQWEINRYTVTLNSAGVPDTLKNIEAPFDSVIILPTLTREDHFFVGWFGGIVGGEKFGDGGNEHIVVENVIMFARWAPSVTITFNSQGGAEADPIESGVGQNIILPNSTRNNDVFRGWFSEEENGLFFGRGGDTLNVTASVTMYAQWGVGVTFISHGGTNFPPEELDIGGGEVTLPTPIRSGFNFLGWWSAETDGTRLGLGGVRITVTESVIMHARWQAN
jgi:uncharacterized repeat protein (TIGR02543 family)